MSRRLALVALGAAIILLACTTPISMYKNNAGVRHSAGAAARFSRGNKPKVLPHSLFKSDDSAENPTSVP